MKNTRDFGQELGFDREVAFVVINKPVFKASFHVEVVDPEGVFLLSERGHFVLKGKLHCQLAPLVDGCRTVDDIVDGLADKVTPAEAYYALGLLEKKGYIVEADGAIPSDRAAFWHTLDQDPRLAERHLKEATVSLIPFGNMAVEPLASILSALNIRVGEHGDFAVVLTDDYLQEGLSNFNATALASRQPWLLIKPLGTTLWIGPVFRPGKTACWECLAQRLHLHRRVESYLQNRKETAVPFPTSRAGLPATVQTALHLAAIEIAKAIAHSEYRALDGNLITLDVRTLDTQKHTLVRRPQCPLCGHLAHQRNSKPVPVTLQSQEKRFVADGGHRITPPEQTVAKYEHHISIITGVVSHLTHTTADEQRFIHTYSAGYNLAHECDSLYFLRQGLRVESGGKGMTDIQAKASGLCEALEHYSGWFQGDEVRKRACFRRLGSSAIHPNSCMLFSEKQYQHRQEWNTRGSKTQMVPDPLDERAEIEWTPIWSLTNQKFKYLPTSYCYYNYPLPPSVTPCYADSNGNAAGNTLEEAILHGLLELVERDSVCLWWYNRIQRPAVNLDSFDEPYIQELRKHYRTLNRDVWVLDLTSDLRIPVFAAISQRIDQDAKEILVGFGAHLDPRIGVLRALTELNQFVVYKKTLDEKAEYLYEEYEQRELRYWCQTATLADQLYLAPDDTAPRAFSDYDLTWSDDIREDVLCCQEIVEHQGMEMLVLDQTRPDIGLPVAKVIVPGLRHFWARLGPGRLYDVPVKLGWIKQPLAEDQLNPIPMFF